MSADTKPVFEHVQAILKSILVADIPPYWPKSGPQSVGLPLLDQNKNVPPY